MIGTEETIHPLEAASPFELRVNQSANVPESAVKTALRTGDIGFLHSFTTGSTVDGPSVRVVGWTAGKVVPPARFQRATFRLGGGRSMQLSYGSTGENRKW
jgi:hypothetical protein